jgi:glycosyltransferase involved in cell wall biosynthesis
MATSIIALTQTEKRILIQKFHVQPKRIHVIPNGIEMPKNKTAITLDEKKRILSKYRLNPNFKTIITIGRIAKNKGQIYLIKAASNLQNLNVIIIGRDWGEKDRLIRYVKENKIKNIFILENISDLDKIKLLSIADVFVLSSIASEAFGIVLLEAMSNGVPVVASNVGGVSDLIVEGKNGYLVRPGNVDEIERKIKLILGSEKNNKMRQFCLDYVSNFDWDNIYLKIKNVYTTD